MKQDVIHKLEKYAYHLAGLFNTNCRIVDITNQCFVSELFGEAQYFYPHCSNTSCDLLNTYLYGCSEAYRWGGKYIFYCHEGFVFVASSVSDEKGVLSGGLVLGPIIMGDLEDTLHLYHDSPVAEAVQMLSNISTDKVNHIAEIMACITESVSGIEHSLIGSVSFKQEDILQSLYSQKQFYGEEEQYTYPHKTERQLEQCIRDGDKHGAQRILNDLLGQIYFISNFNLDTIRIRMIELLTVLSRATIDAGANSNEIFWFRSGCVTELQGCKTLDEISVWLTGILHRFIRYSFDFSSLKHSDTVYRVIEYIRNNYYKKISLDEIAKDVNFSKAYLSRIFKEETGENISMYINRIRIEKAKVLLTDKQIKLIDVANLVGFEDQSYFTKVFKSVTGMSPKKYKENRKNK